MPLLQKYWPGLGLPAASRVLVPLCGKSLDMAWLAQQGHAVLGVELSPLAITQFFDEHALQPRIHESPCGMHYVHGNIEILCGDIFNLDRETLGGCAAVYDRAALIALPESMRDAYVSHVYGGLPTGFQGLLITLDYLQDQMAGPPFSVPDSEVQSLLSSYCTAGVVDRRSVLKDEPKFMDRGVTALDSVVYHLQGRFGA